MIDKQIDSENCSDLKLLTERVKTNEEQIGGMFKRVDELKEVVASNQTLWNEIPKLREDLILLREKHINFEGKLELLTNTIENLTKVLWWVVGLGGTTLVSFLFKQLERLMIR